MVVLIVVVVLDFVLETGFTVVVMPNDLVVGLAVVVAGTARVVVGFLVVTTLALGAACSKSTFKGSFANFGSVILLGLGVVESDPQPEIRQTGRAKTISRTLI